LGKKGAEEHSGHELKKPMRATKVLLEMMDNCKNAVARDGSVGIASKEDPKCFERGVGRRRRSL
jgi:hypothetical protein